MAWCRSSTMLGYTLPARGVGWPIMGWGDGCAGSLWKGLEQLRFLENGHPVRVVEVSAPGAGVLGV